MKNFYSDVWFKIFFSDAAASIETLKRVIILNFGAKIASKGEKVITGGAAATFQRTTFARTQFGSLSYFLAPTAEKLGRYKQHGWVHY